MSDRETRAIVYAISVLEYVAADEAAQDAGLWQGEMIPRAVESLEALLPPAAETLESRWLRQQAEKIQQAAPRLVEALQAIKTATGHGADYDYSTIDYVYSLAVDALREAGAE